MNYKPFTPPTSYETRKSDAGRPMHYTGSVNYPGAASLAAVAAARAGADYVVFRGVSDYQMPDFIVRDDKAGQNSPTTRATAVLTGCGISRAASAEVLFCRAVSHARTLNIPLVVDADGLIFIGQLLRAERSLELPQIVILTPNFRELQALGGSAQEIAKKLHCIVVAKEKADLVTDGETTLASTVEGAPHRCCGQGDVLAGVLSTFVGFDGPVLEKCRFACDFVRLAAEKAWERLLYSSQASDLIDEFPNVWRELLTDSVTFPSRNAPSQ